MNNDNDQHICKDEVNILHLSDLHYGIENDPGYNGKRSTFRQKEVFIKLIKTLADNICVPESWKPDIVVISGDIGWRGSKDDYDLFQNEFLTPLTKTLAIDKQKVITCPGNHDIVRAEAEGFERPYKDQRALEVKPISRESIGTRRVKHFENYVNSMCEGDPQKMCQSITFEEWPWVRFLIMNSAWDCRDNTDEGKLRVGLKLLEEIAGPENEDEVIVSIFHHPHNEVSDYNFENEKRTKRNWLHITEREPEHLDGTCFLNFLEQRSDFVLNGHIHQETKPQHSKEAKAIQLISGAAYSNDTTRYHCRILKLRQHNPAQYMDLRCTLGGGDHFWEVTSPKSFQIFGYYQTNSERKAEKKEQTILKINEATAATLEKNYSLTLSLLQELLQLVAEESNIENRLENRTRREENETTFEHGASIENIRKGPLKP